MNKRLLLGFCCLWLAVFGFACNGISNSNQSELHKPTSENKTGPKVVVVLFDLSDSTGAEDVRRRYLEAFTRILEKVRGGDTLAVDSINENPLSKSTLVVNEQFPEFKPTTDNSLLQQKEREDYENGLKDRREKAFNSVQSMLALAKDKVLKTKILDSTLLAERVFHTYNLARKVLVIFSDMIEESENYNFQRQPPDDKLTKRFIDEQTKANRLPDLKGVKVYVVGASASTYKQNSSQAYMNIENLWLRYFQAAGAELSKDRYGAALINFEE